MHLLNDKERVFILKFIDLNELNLNKKRLKFLKNQKLRVYAIKFLPTLFVALFSGSFLIPLILGLVWWFVSTMIFDHRYITEFSPTIRMWFGVPGAGKTTMAAYLTNQSIKGGYNVLSNVELKGAYKLEVDDLGKYDTSFNGDGAHVIIDEGSLTLDNRNYKNFAQTTKPLYFALHRHLNNRVDVFSQGYDIDKRVRDRIGSNGMFYLQKIGIPYFIMYRRINKILFIKKEDKQIIDGFEFKGLPRFLFTPPLWKCFDTEDTSLCPKEQKEWEKW